MPVPLVMPKLGLTMTEGRLTRWMVAEGEEVRKGQILFEAETDKITVEVEAESDGRVHIAVEAGATVPVLGITGYLLAAGEAAPGQPRERVASPAAKRRARELGVDLEQVPCGGDRISVADVEAFAASRLPAPAASASDAVTPFTGVRKLIAERMLASARETAPVTLTSEVDAGELVELRKRSGASYNAAFVKIAARGLLDFPDIHVLREGGGVRPVTAPVIGVAVDTPRGLLVPVIRDAHRRSLADVARELGEKSARAQQGNSLPEDIETGSFTITNLGSHGVDAFTPIINLPQIAILGVGRIREQPVAWQGRVELRHRVVLSLTFDHQVTDGMRAARFLQRIAALLEQPGWMLEDAVHA